MHNESVHNTHVQGFIVLRRLTMLNMTNAITSETKFSLYDAAHARLAYAPKCSLRAVIGLTGAVSRAPCNRCRATRSLILHSLSTARAQTALQSQIQQV